jgi:hypothetical protein
MATMDARLKTSWLPVTLVLFGLVLLIGSVENRLPPGSLRMGLELGIVVVGFAGIFLWTYLHRELSPKQPHPHPGQTQTIDLTVEPQLGMFYYEQGEYNLYSAWPEQEKRL